MQVISKFNKETRFYYMLLLINIYGLFFLKDKKRITIVNSFQKVLNKSDRRPNKIWIDKGTEF